MATPATTPAVPTVHAVSLKLPTFWPDEPDIWFAQAESQFSIRGITTDTTKFHYVVAALDGQTARRVGDLLRAPTADPYADLKKRLLAAFTLSDRERAARLLDLEDLGDQKPSALVDHILALAGSCNRDFLLREIFLRKLPESIRSIVASSSTSDLRSLGAEADRHFTAAGAMITAVEQRPPSPLSTPTEVLASSRQPRRTPKSNNVCFYHEKFGALARKCRAPCSWGNQTASHRQ